MPHGLQLAVTLAHLPPHVATTCVLATSDPVSSDSTGYLRIVADGLLPLLWPLTVFTCIALGHPVDRTVDLRPTSLPEIPITPPVGAVHMLHLASTVAKVATRANSQARPRPTHRSTCVEQNVLPARKSSAIPWQVRLVHTHFAPRSS